MNDEIELMAIGTVIEPVDVYAGANKVLKLEKAGKTDAKKGGPDAGNGHFPYLGLTVSETARIDKAVHLRLRTAWAAFHKYQHCVWRVKQLSEKVKSRHWASAVLPALLYGLQAPRLAGDQGICVD